MNNKVVLHFDDINFTVVVAPQEYHVDFTAYYLVDKYDTGERVYHLTDKYLHGFVRWDGCSNWYFNEQDDVMLHFCGRDQLVAVGDLMARCWDWTKENLTTFDN